MLTCKPDWDEAGKRWEHFWNGELWKRPVVMAGVCKDFEQRVAPYWARAQSLDREKDGR